jgi:hypothetical protein
MKILITEQQLNILLEETNGLDSLLGDIVYTYPKTKKYIDTIREFITNSGCRNITVERLPDRIKGLALHDKVVLSTSLFNDNLSLPDFLFVLFHEIAHQYQYKKYGEEKMYEVYTGDMSLENASQWMKETEIIADEFATRKLRQFVKLGLIDPKETLQKGVYKLIPNRILEKLISDVRELVKDKNVTTKEGISELFYNMVKNKL